MKILVKLGYYGLRKCFIGHLFELHGGREHKAAYMGKEPPNKLLFWIYKKPGAGGAGPAEGPS